MRTKNITLKSNSIFNAEIPVRISDINYGNHLGHDSLISLLHEARVQCFNHYGYTELDVCGCGILMTSINVNYLAQAFYPDNLCVDVSLGEKTKSSLELLYQVQSREQEKEIARASTVMVFYDYDKNKVVRIPEDFLAKLF